MPKIVIQAGQMVIVSYVTSFYDVTDVVAMNDQLGLAYIRDGDVYMNNVFNWFVCIRILSSWSYCVNS